MLVGTLSISSQQLVEIAKALTLDCRILILDEPTAALTEPEAQVLFGIMRDLAARGISIIYISHRMVEIFENCDRVSVFRDGRRIVTADVADITPDFVVNNMVGRVIGQLYPPKRAEPQAPDALLEVRGLSDGRRFRDVGFTLGRGEILGIAGLIGAGRSEIVKGICGLRPGTTRRRSRSTASRLPIRSYRDSIDNGVVYLSEDRKGDGVFIDLSIAANISALDLDQVSTPWGTIDAEKEAAQATALGDRLGLKRGGIHDPVSSLSGGNQQKVAIAKMLSVRPRVIFLDEPTRGVDVGAQVRDPPHPARPRDERGGHRRGLLGAPRADRPLRPRAGGARGADQRRGRRRRADRGEHHPARLLHRARHPPAAGVPPVTEAAGQTAGGTAGGRGSGLGRRLVRQREAGLVLVILLLFAVMSVASPYFLTWENMRAMTMAFAIEGIVVVGMTILLISGGIDLSVGSVVAFSMVLAGWLFLQGVDPWVASGLAILASAGIGLAMGLCVTRIGLHHFIVSLAFMVIVRGACLLFTGGRPLGLFTLPPEFKFIGQGSVGPIPFVIILFVIFVLVFDFLLRRSTAFRKVFYTGSNVKAAAYSGIRTQRVILATTVLCSTLAGFAGIIYMARFGSAQPTFGVGMELNVIAAAVIGGASLSGGQGTIFGAILGAVLLSVVSSSLALLNVSVYWQDIIRGSILLAAVSFDLYLHKRKTT